MIEQATVWCDKAGFLVTQDDIDKRCPYWECPCKQHADGERENKS